MDITRYIVGLAVLLVATIIPLLAAHWIMLRVSSPRDRHLQQFETAAEYVSAAPRSIRIGSTRDGSRRPVAALRLR